MDAAALFNERKADVAAFSALLFNTKTAAAARAAAAPLSTPKQAEKTQAARNVRSSKKAEKKVSRASARTSLVSFPSASPATAAYRRPASANVPVSRVLREVKARIARQQRMESAAATSKRGKGSAARSAAATAAASASSSTPVSAFGFTAQELRDRTYLLMSGYKSNRLDAVENVSRAAATQSAQLTPQQEAQLRKLRIKRTHQRLLSHAQWRLWLRRRRRLWQRRRVVSRRRHVARRLALQHGRPLPPCTCCRGHTTMKRNTASRTPAKGRQRRPRQRVPGTSSTQITQWLPSHARLVKRLQHQVVSVAVPPAMAHNTSHKTGGRQQERALRKKAEMSVVRVSIPAEPKRKGHRFLQRWIAALGARQHAAHHGRTGEAPQASPQQQTKKNRHSTSNMLDTTLISDLSHECVYTVRLRRRGFAAEGGTQKHATQLDDVMAALQLRPTSTHIQEKTTSTGIVFSTSPTARHQRVKESGATVVHGHMWSAAAVSANEESNRTIKGAVSTLARRTRVVPVVLIGFSRRNIVRNGTAISSAQDYLLFSDVPVRISGAAENKLRVQLVSAWNPCSLCPSFASVYEYWRWETPSSSSSPRQSQQQNKEPDSAAALTTGMTVLKEVLRHCVRSYRRLRQRSVQLRERERQQQRLRGRHSTKRSIDGSKKKLEGSNAGKTSRGAKVRSGSANKSPTSGAPAKPDHTVAHLRRRPRVSLIVFPSLPAPFLQLSARQQHAGLPLPYVWRVAFLYHRRDSTKASKSPQKAPERLTRPRKKAKSEGERHAADAPAATAAAESEKRILHAAASARRLYNASAAARRTHFQLARRLFGALVFAPFHAAALHPPSSRKTRGKSRVLGSDDRATLLRLVGRPAYPLDYGLSRPSSGTEQRRRQETSAIPTKHLVTCRGGMKRRRSDDSSLARHDEAAADNDTAVDGAIPPPLLALPSYKHTLEYYGNLTTAARRVTVRSAQLDKKLPALHRTVGAILLRCHRSKLNVPQAFKAPLPMQVTHIGVVSSTGFFAQRFGCVVVPVWCCFPPSTVETADVAAQGGSVERQQTAPLGVAAHPSTMHLGDAYVLAPPASAEALLLLSASLQRAEPPRQRHVSRHQRRLDLVRGREARQLEALLCDPTFCSAVQLIEWYG